MLITIERMLYDETGTHALVTDYNSQVKYLVMRNDEGFILSNEEGETLERFKNLRDTIHSDFYSVYNALQQMYEAGIKYYGGSVLNEMVILKTDTFAHADVYTARYNFKYRNREYSAYAIKDYSGETPDFLYFLLISGEEEPAESFKFLYQAVASEFYPVFAQVDAQIDEMMEAEEAENG